MEQNAIAVGLRGHNEQIVTPQMSARSVGSGLVDVLATPMMIALMENTCSDSLLPLLDESQSSVGTRVNISHLAATPIGMRIWCDAELTEVDGRRLTFSVRAFDEGGLIGEGTHERFIIDKVRFMAKTSQRGKNNA